MRKLTAIILSATAIVVFSSDAEARRLGISFRSVSKPVAPVSSGAQTRSGTFVMISTNRNNQNGPFAAAPRDPVPASGPLHEIAAAVDQTPPAAEKPAEKPAEQPVEQKPEPPMVRTTPIFVSLATPKPIPVAEKTPAPAQPVKMVYCAVQAKGGCAPF